MMAVAATSQRTATVLAMAPCAARLSVLFEFGLVNLSLKCFGRLPGAGLGRRTAEARFEFGLVWFEFGLVLFEFGLLNSV